MQYPDSVKETFRGGDIPTLTVTRPDGGIPVSMSGDKALANAAAPEAKAWQAANPYNTELLKHQYGDVRDGLTHNIGSSIRNFATNRDSTLMGRLANGGMLPGGLIGAGGGLLAGVLAGWIRNKITGSKTSPWLTGAAGMALGGGIGTYAGHVRSRGEVPQLKQAAMFVDPRNFILEKLQGSTDIGMSQKAQLAASVRTMDHNTATRLADAVRAAVGFGVGALIAKFIFGASGPGALFGGLAGVLGGALVHQMFGSNKTPTSFGVQPNPYNY